MNSEDWDPEADSDDQGGFSKKQFKLNQPGTFYLTLDSDEESEVANESESGPSAKGYMSEECNGTGSDCSDSWEEYSAPNEPARNAMDEYEDEVCDEDEAYYLRNQRSNRRGNAYIESLEQYGF